MKREHFEFELGMFGSILAILLLITILTWLKGIDKNQLEHILALTTLLAAPVGAIQLVHAFVMRKSYNNNAQINKHLNRYFLLVIIYFSLFLSYNLLPYSVRDIIVLKYFFWSIMLGLPAFLAFYLLWITWYFREKEE
jgi:cobalamin synthase